MKYWMHERTKEVCKSSEIDESDSLLCWVCGYQNLETSDLRPSGCGATIHTSFRCVDARTSGLDLEHIKEPLVFVTCIVGGAHSGIRTFWSTYAQATLGHMYWVLKHAAMNTQNCIMQIREEEGIGYQLTDRHEHASIALRDVTLKKLDCRSTVESMISHIGADGIADLIRANDYIPRSKRLPIVLPIAGYPSDIERFIQL
jgi:hypothetical protein